MSNTNDGIGQNGDNRHLTTDQGVKVDHTDDSLKAGPRGATLMEDFHFREKMTHFDHERIPERVVHARGSGAYGVFKVFDDSMKEFTKAKFLTDSSRETKVFVRFSTVVGFRGSADTVRDVRGFAAKFYTAEGNYDLVGNNMPVFFIQDAMKFPDLVHAIKPEPHNEMPQASAAHDNFWDFISLMPESMHMIMWVLSDRALPRSYSMMEGFGVHTFRLINEEGKATFVKFHWKPVNGVHSLTWDETQKIAGKDPDFNRRDLWESIEEGNFPEFVLGVQLLDESKEFDFDFDVLDATKIWPEELIPVRKVGKLTLNRNPDNFFAETEQVAFHPGNLVPGIDFTNDPLLQGRLFSYVDTQLIRLGGPNFTEIPINRPESQVHNNERDGYMRQTVHKGRVNYSPNSLAKGQPTTASAAEGAFVHYTEKVEGYKTRARSESFKDHFTQARLFYNSMTEPEKKHILEAFHFELGKVETLEIRERMVGLIAHIDSRLAEDVAKGIGVEKVVKAVVDQPKQDAGKTRIDNSPALSMELQPKSSIKGRKIAVLLEDGFDAEQFMAVKAAITKAGAKMMIVSKLLGHVKSAGGESVKVDKTHLTAGSIIFDAVFVPGGAHVTRLQQMGDVKHFLLEAFKHCKPIALSGDATALMKVINIQLNDTAIADIGIVLAERGDWNAFAQDFSVAIAQHRFWKRESLIEMIPA
ncbi:MAG: catalase [Sphingobacteriales bacterium]|nr:MAG: catalase [Sphingobacteriales bacterium]